MNTIYPFLISFFLIFLAELGDKTQLLILSVSSKSKVHNIILGIAIGSLLSHGIAITFGSSLIGLTNHTILKAIKLFTYITFLVIGITGFIPKKETTNKHQNNLLQKLSNSSLNYVIIVALCIIIGEIGDKTFLASIGLGVEYPNYKFSLITGAVLGMIISNSTAIIFGKFLEKHFSERFIEILSNIIFILFGLIGILMLGGQKGRF